MSGKPSSVQEAKKLAKVLRTKLAENGMEISHSKSLELVAEQHGFRDWNGMYASFGNRPKQEWQRGDRVSGRYLGQTFEGEISNVKQIGDGWYRIGFKFDKPVDVVTFEGMSNFRSRTSQVIGPDGMTLEKTSDGKPHMVLDI